MREITQHERVLPDGTTIETFACDIVDCNILNVEAGTTGYCGGDTGHGGRTYFRIEDAASTDLVCNAYTNKHANGAESKGFEVILGGDAELDTIIEALKFIQKVLKAQRRESEVERI